jgi:hypothetical protein
MYRINGTSFFLLEYLSMKRLFPFTSSFWYAIWNFASSFIFHSYLFIVFPTTFLFTYRHLHLFNEAALRVGLPFESFIGPGIPLMRAQNDFLRFAALLPGFTLPVTAVFSLLPGFFRLYADTPFLVIPAPSLVLK